MKKALKIVLIVMASILSFLVVVWGGLMVAKEFIYRDYLKEAEKVCRIPDLNSGFTPQGITHIEGDTYLQSGYDGEHLALYYIEGKEAKKLTPLDEDGDKGTGHGGGITHAGEYVYIAGEESLLCYRLEDIKNAQANAELTCVKRIKIESGSSFCFADGKNLWVGEFYRPGNYETDLAHAYTTPANQENRAIVSCYDLNQDGSFADEVPEYRISIPGLVQGIAFYDGKIAISRSWGLNSSSLEFYNGMLESGKTVVVQGHEIPLYYIDSTNLIKSVKLPPFSEDLSVEGDRVVINFESACNKYIIGKLFFAYWATSYPFPK